MTPRDLTSGKMLVLVVVVVVMVVVMMVLLVLLMVLRMLVMVVLVVGWMSNDYEITPMSLFLVTS